MQVKHNHRKANQHHCASKQQQRWGIFNFIFFMSNAFNSHLFLPFYAVLILDKMKVTIILDQINSKNSVIMRDKKNYRKKRLLELLSQGYTIFDLEGNILHKDEIHLRDTKWGYRRYDYVNNYQKKKNAL